jgi:hypothetical protein
MRIFLLLLLLLPPLLPLSGCRPQKSVEPLVKAGAYQSSPEELRRLWSDVLIACQRDERQRVHDLMASFVMTRPELETLLGPAQAQALWPRYLAMLGSLANAGAVELVAHVYEKKYDDIAVNRVDDLPAAEQVDSDRNVAQALAKAGATRPFYTVRVKRKTETRGLRYDFFVYINGYWRSGNLIGKFLPAVSTPAAAPAAPEPAVKPAPVAPEAPPAPTENPTTSVPAAAK